jgi:6-phosphogluconolactonase
LPVCAEGGAYKREPLFVKETLSDPSSPGPRQHAGAIHVHPNGRFVYLTNRDSGTLDIDPELTLVPNDPPEQ